MPTPERQVLPAELKALVRESVALLGEVIRRELGQLAYARVERIRRRMAALRGKPSERVRRELRLTLAELARLTPPEREGFALAYALMLETMNACENAYRARRLREHGAGLAPPFPDAIIYVLTAHPTEARSPENIEAFHQLQAILIEALEHGFDARRERVRHALELAWRTPLFRTRKPSVQDEADHVHSTFFRSSNFRTFLKFGQETTPAFVRSWVGGDKDGHPGVDRHATAGSLQSSRERLLEHTRGRLSEVKRDLELWREAPASRKLRSCLARVEAQLRGLARLRPGDAGRVRALRSSVRGLDQDYVRALGVDHPSLRELHWMLQVFPGLVLPLELRETSDVFMEADSRRGGRRPAIEGMMRWISGIARGGDARWYARGLIISMASTAGHVHAALRSARRCMGDRAIPVVPLFEQESSLLGAAEVVRELLEDASFKKRVRSWGGLEIMVGYSDSSKEAGVLPSRLGIAIALEELERLCRRQGVKPIFFHGSGGSVDRGGGSIRDQARWWPRGALHLYKATIQGEMVERSFASPEITRGQLERIAGSASALLKRPKLYHPGPGVREFSARVAEAYRRAVAARDFLELVESATPYRYLSALRIGSRPTKRQVAELSVGSLRAIPWVLCWTQTRVLFPTWWGTGRAWRESSASDRARLKRAFRTDPMFGSYVRALGFSLAKVELPVWRMYLERSGLDPQAIEVATARFEIELEASRRFFTEVTGKRDLLWFRPWLGESIRLRAPMIHPLNLLQILAVEDRDLGLLRTTVTGIASGMMTTG